MNIILKKIVTLWLQTETQKPGQGKAGGSADIMECVYSTLFLGLLKLRNFHGIVKNEANGRCQCGYVYIVNSLHANVDC